MAPPEATPTLEDVADAGARLDRIATTAPGRPRRRRGRRHHSTLLAFEDDGERLTGALVRVEHEQPAVVHHGSLARSRFLETDLRHLLDSLAEAGPLPTAAILVTGEATAVCLNLPQTDALSTSELTSLVRMELETFVVSSPTEGSWGASGPEAIASGWVDLELRPADAPLFAAGMPRDRRDAIATAFAGAGLRLEGLFPLLGGAPALLDGDTLRGPVRSIEVGEDRVACADLLGGQVVRFRVVRCGERDPAEVCRSLCEDETTPAVLVGPLPEAVPAALEGLRTSWHDVAREPGVSASLLGASRQVLGLAGGERVPRISARPPRPPLLSLAPVRILLVVVFTVLLLAAADATSAGMLRSQQQDVDDLEQEIEERQAEAERQAAHSARLQSLEAKESSWQRRLAVQDVCAKRVTRLRGLLDALTRVIPPQLTLDEVRGTGAGEVVLVGFGLTEVAIQRFAQRLERALQPHGLRPGEPVVHSQRGRMGLDGYQFRLHLRLSTEAQ